MKVIHALEALPDSIFLAGPTPRDEGQESWRPRALTLLEGFGFKGTVFVPESSNWQAHDNYMRQVNWEWDALYRASVVAFWLPRDIQNMPGFTTNIEFGLMAMSKPERVVFGRPLNTPKTKYLEAVCVLKNIPVYDTLPTLLQGAMNLCLPKKGAT
jgi:hypothetical protein